MSDEPKKMGRPPLDIKFLGPQICDGFRYGNSIAGAIAGLIHRNTYLDWYNKGEDDFINGVESDFSEFFNNVNTSKQEYVTNLREHIEKAAPKDWKAASWLMERKDPDTYHLKQKIEATQTIEHSQKAMIELPQNERRAIDTESL